jgi:integrase
MGKLSARTVATAKPGRHGDGRGLWLAVAPSGAKKWVFRFTWQGKVTETGLGSATLVTLLEAREKAQEARLMVARGINPVKVKEASKAASKAPAVLTFGQCAEMVFTAKNPAWRSAIHARQWQNSLARHTAPIRDTPVDEIELQSVLAILQPIWLTIPETARRLRTRIETILDFAKARGWRTGENVARWRGNLSHLLPQRPKIEQSHFPALDYHELPEFMANLRKEETVARLCLEFLILTASRSAEAREIWWSEIDFDSAIWSLPPQRMKGGRRHVVPLSARAVQILEIMRGRSSDGDFIFPSTKAGRPISFLPLYAILPDGATLHGFRSSFRDWCGEETSYPREIAEQALAHVAGSAVELAYRRGDALQKRRHLMQCWADYCGRLPATNVISIGADGSRR